MKKVLMSVFALSLVISSVAIKAQAPQQAAPTQTTAQKVTVKPEELPEGVKTALKGPDYAGWEVASASVDKDVYVIDLKKGDQKNTVRLNKDGKKAD